MIEITSDNFDAEVLQSDLPVLVEFGAEWCSPCKMMAPILEQLASENSDRIKIGQVDTTDQPVLTARYSVSSVPALILFVNGSPTKRKVGLQNKSQLKAFVGL